jgi:hypothetical protein
VSRSFDVGGHTRDRGACVRRTRTAAKAWPPNEKYQVLTILPLRGVYLLLVVEVAWSFAPPGETSYI